MYDAHKKVYSFSKLSTFNDCPYRAYLTYKEHRKGAESVYGILGTCVHDKLEAIMKGEADNDELKKALNEDLQQLDLLDLHFPKDFKGGDSIRDNWIADMTHFVEHFEKPEGEFKTEEFLVYKVDDDHYMQGYADLVRIDGEGKQSIFDWKTSSMYDTQGFKEHGRQLVIYALAKEQEGIKINEVAWYFLKYITVEFMGKKRANSKNKTQIIKHINRRKIGEELANYIRDDLYEAGYDEITVESYLMDVERNNSLDGLPEKIKAGYIFKPCVIYYELTDEVKNECRKYIENSIYNFEALGDNPEEWEPRSFYKATRYGVQEDTFFCNTLCDHRGYCQYLEAFKQKKKAEEISYRELL